MKSYLISQLEWIVFTLFLPQAIAYAGCITVFFFFLFNYMLYQRRDAKKHNLHAHFKNSEKSRHTLWMRVSQITWERAAWLKDFGTGRQILWHECCGSVAKSYLILCDPMNCSIPNFPVLHYPQEFSPTHVHWVGDAIQPSHPLSSLSPPAFNLFQHLGLFQWVSCLHQVAKVLELQFDTRLCLI